MEAIKVLAPKIKKSKEKDFRIFLQDELTQRCSRNPNYSLRSFARSLSVSSSALSAILSGKRPLTNRMKERLGLCLGLTPEEITKYRSTPHGNSRFKSEVKQDPPVEQVTIDTFAIISEPYHYAILELMKTIDFQGTPSWIAQRLHLTISEIKIALERLERVGMLKQDERGVLQDNTSGFSTDIREGLSSQGQRLFLEKSLERSIQAIRSVPVEKRDNTSMTVAINSADLLRAKRFIKDFRRKFCSNLESTENPNEVYQLNISFIPITKRSGEKK